MSREAERRHRSLMRGWVPQFALATDSALGSSTTSSSVVLTQCGAP
jgi:hypothetical protein